MTALATRPRTRSIAADVGAPGGCRPPPTSARGTGFLPGARAATRGVVVALHTTALDERGWPSFAEDPNGAVKRAARSIADLAIDRRVVVAHCLPQQTTSWLGEQLDGAGVGASLMLCAIGDAHDCPYAAASDLAVFLDAEMLVLVTPAPVVRDDDTARAIRSASASALVALETDAELELPIDAATRFVTKTGRSAAIGAIDHLESIVAGEGGTLIRDDGAPPEFYGAETAAT